MSNVMDPYAKFGTYYSDIGSSTSDYVRSFISQKNFLSSKESLDEFEAEFKVSLLMLTSFLGHLDLVSTILNTSYVDINKGVESVYNATPLHVAVIHEHLDIVHVLLSYEANVNIKTYPVPPLIIAITQNNIKIARALIEAGANIDERDGINYCTALIYASLAVKPVLVETLMQSGADVNATSKSGMNPVHALTLIKIEASNITEVDRNEILLLLIHGKADINAQAKNGNTPLHYAVRTGLTNVIKMLLRAGADPDKLNKVGMTPLGESIEYPFRMKLPNPAYLRDIVKLLVEEGADTNLSNPLAIATNPRIMDKEIIELLIDNGAKDKCFILHKSSTSPLLQTLLYNRTDLAKLILQNEVDPNCVMVTVISCISTFTLAINSGEIEIVRELIRQGADPTVSMRLCKNLTHFHSDIIFLTTAITKLVYTDAEAFEIVDFLITAGLDVNDKQTFNKNSMDILEASILNNYTAVSSRIIDAGLI